MSLVLKLLAESVAAEPDMDAYVKMYWQELEAWATDCSRCAEVHGLGKAVLAPDPVHPSHVSCTAGDKVIGTFAPRYGVGAVRFEAHIDVRFRLCRVCKSKPCADGFDHCGGGDCLPF
jgi:hypothetical protein